MFNCRQHPVRDNTVMVYPFTIPYQIPTSYLFDRDEAVVGENTLAFGDTTFSRHSMFNLVWLYGFKGARLNTFLAVSS